MVKQQYYNAQEIATMCNISTSSAYNLMKKLGETRVGSRKIIECSKVREYLEKHTHPPVVTERERRQARLRGL